MTAFYLIGGLVLWNSWLTWRLHVHGIAFKLVSARVAGLTVDLAQLREDAGLS